MYLLRYVLFVFTWKSIEETLLKKRMKRKGRCFHFILNVVSHGQSYCSIGIVLAQCA